MPKGKPRSISQTQPSLANIPPPEMKGPRKGTIGAPPVPQHPSRGGELFIVDNSDEDWKVAEYLREWRDVARAFDIATGYFEIGGLLALDGNWQKLDQICILMGDEVSKRTQKAFNEALSRNDSRLDTSIEETKEKNDFLIGVPAVVQASQTDGRRNPMHQIDTLTRIAKTLGTDVKGALRFCEQVQKETKPPIPLIPLIAYYLVRSCGKGRDPQALARIIEDARLGAPYTLLENRKPEREVKLFFSAEDELPKCPHGIPRVQKCRLCDRAESDWDEDEF